MADPTRKKKEEQQNGGLMPLANRMGLSAGVNTVSPPRTSQLVHGAPLGSLVETAMERRRNQQEAGLPLEDDSARNRVARQSGQPKRDLFNNGQR